MATDWTKGNKVSHLYLYTIPASLPGWSAVPRPDFLIICVMTGGSTEQGECLEGQAGTWEEWCVVCDKMCSSQSDDQSQNT